MSYIVRFQFTFYSILSTVSLHFESAFTTVVQACILLKVLILVCLNVSTVSLHLPVHPIKYFCVYYRCTLCVPYVYPMCIYRVFCGWYVILTHKTPWNPLVACLSAVHTTLFFIPKPLLSTLSYIYLKPLLHLHYSPFVNY